MRVVPDRIMEALTSRPVVGGREGSRGLCSLSTPFDSDMFGVGLSSVVMEISIPIQKDVSTGAPGQEQKRKATRPPLGRQM